MRLSLPITLFVPAMAAGLLLAGCSLMLAWEEDEHPCNEADQCYEEYSCRAGKCIPVESLAEGESCTLDDQCAEKRTCEGFACRTQCSQYFTIAGCGAAQYCKPVLVAGDSCETSSCPTGQFRRNDDDGTCRCHYYQGVCLDGDDCTRATEVDDCASGDVCVAMSASVNACLDGCEIPWSTTDYTDTCGSLPGAPRYCTEVGGTADGTRLVCIDTYVGAAAVGDACDPVSPTPCRAQQSTTGPGLACVAAKCRVHCAGDNVAGNLYCSGDSTFGGDFCCTQAELSDDQYAVCGTDCNF